MGVACETFIQCERKKWIGKDEEEKNESLWYSIYNLLFNKWFLYDKASGYC